MTMTPTPQAIFAEIDRAALVMALTRGATRRKWAKYRKNCLELLHATNPVDPVTAAMTDDELLAELLGAK